MINRELIVANSEIFSERFGLDLSRNPFQWFLLSVLFGARISRSIAVKTFVMFRTEGITTPEAIIDAGFDRIVSILDSGGYARYDFRTALKLEELSRNTMRAGGLNNIHGSSASFEDLIADLKALAKGIGDVTVGIFMREMTGVWEKARPYPSKLVLQGANFAGLRTEDYKKYGVSYSRFESFLLKIGKECVRGNRRKESGFCRLILEK